MFGKSNGLKSPLLEKGRTPSIITHRDAEEESFIQEIKAFKHSKHKTILFWTGSIVTCGILYLLDFWFLKLHLRLRYKEAAPEEATHLLVKSENYTELVLTKTKNTRDFGLIPTFEYHQLPYYYRENTYRPIYFDVKVPHSEIIQKYSQGMQSADEIANNKEIFGNCEIRVPKKGVGKLFLEEMLHPFYIFQIGSCVLWFSDGYTYYAYSILLITIVSLVSSLYQTNKNIKDLNEMAFFKTKVKALRQGVWELIESVELVPGDVIEIPEGDKMPCDAILLSGSCIVEEGMLTGESVPVLKDHLAHTQSVFDIETDKKSLVYQGTKVLQTKNFASERVTAVVIRTGFTTMKGKLVRSILYPKPSKFKFYSDSMKFIGVLAILSVVGFGLSLPWQLHIGVPFLEMIDQSLDLITVTVPPALPAAMTIGTAFAINRLKSKQVFCISPPRVNVAGKIGVCCFDKTGTLTEDGMELLGVQSSYNSLSELSKESKKAGSFLLEQCMACCHSLSKLSGRVIGDPQELEIFNNTGWFYEEASSLNTKAILTNPEVDFSERTISHIDTLRIFHFSSQRQRMGVLVKNNLFENIVFFEKGAPEVVLEKCCDVPKNAKEHIKEYTRCGYRVLACAMKHLPKMNWDQVKSVTLEEAEEGELNFLGLVVLRNKLKHNTAETLEELHGAGIRTIMATGDAILTGVSVGKEVGMIKNEVYIGDLKGGKVVWTKNNQEVEAPWTTLGFETKYDIALTGPAFTEIYKAYKWGNIRNVVPLRVCLEKCQVYARMSPEQKTTLVELMQEHNFIVGMCGDGANDCGALKAADIGISLSESETSIAAPFNSRTGEISCVLEVLKEGRCALTTSLQCFKFMALYSMVQFFQVTMLYILSSNLSDPQFLIIDLFTILPLAVFMSRTKPYPKLSKRQPTASLISVPVLTSVIGQSLLAILTLGFGYLTLTQMEFFSPRVYKPGESIEDFLYSWENSFIFIVGWFQYQSICMVFSIGKPWKKPAHTNVCLISTFSVLMIWTLSSILWQPLVLREIEEVKEFPFFFRVAILFLCLSYAAVSFLLDKLVVTWLEVINKKRKAHRRYLQKLRDLRLE